MNATPSRCSLTIFAPSPILTVTVEPGSRVGEVHFHAGGQGVWVARMAETPSPVLGRHELDDLFGMTVTSGLGADAVLLTGERQDGVLPADTYERIAEDLRSNGRTVIADLAREPLGAALRGGLDVAKLSSEELCAYGRAKDESVEELTARSSRTGRATRCSARSRQRSRRGDRAAAAPGQPADTGERGADFHGCRARGPNLGSDAMRIGGEIELQCPRCRVVAVRGPGRQDRCTRCGAELVPARSPSEDVVRAYLYGNGGMRARRAREREEVADALARSA